MLHLDAGALDKSKMIIAKYFLSFVPITTIQDIATYESIHFISLVASGSALGTIDSCKSARHAPNKF
jgi:hypothetical protein